jgi:holo-[acyl-carrier protein] synthase
MVKAIGTDIVTIERIRAAVERSGDAFVKRILTPFEQQQYAVRSDGIRYLAKRFAAKEAAVKALGTGIGRGISWQHIQIENDEHGAPVLIFTGPAAQRQAQLGSLQAHISIADETDQAIAFVVLS